MGHPGRLDPAGEDGIAAGAELVLETGDLLRHGIFRDKGMVPPVDTETLRIVDVIDPQVGLGPGENAHIVSLAAGGGQHLRHRPVRQHERNGSRQIRPRIEFRAEGGHPPDRAVAIGPDKIDAVDADIEQGAPAQFGTQDPLLVFHRIGKGRRHGPDPSEYAGRQDVPDDVHHRQVAGPYRLSDKDLPRAGQFQDGPRLVAVGHERLFHQAGLPLFERRPGHVEMVGMRGGDIDQVHIGVVQQFRIGTVGTGDVPRPGEGLRFFKRARADRQTGHVRHGVQRPRRLFSNMAGTDDAGLHDLAVCHVPEELFAFGFLDGLEIPVGIDFQFADGILVADDRTGGMALQAAERAVMGHRAFDGILQGTGLLGAECEDDDLLGTEDGGDAHGKGLLRHLVEVAVKETGVDLAGVLGEGHDTGAGLQGGERLVERDVAVFSDAAEEQVETAGRDDRRLIGRAFRDGIFGIAVQDMDVLRRFVDVVEQVAVHEAVVTLRMALRQTDILVHIEGNDILEAELAGLHHADEFGVSLDRRGAGAQAEHEGRVGARGFLTDFVSDVTGGPEGTFRRIVPDDNFHGIFDLWVRNKISGPGKISKA